MSSGPGPRPRPALACLPLAQPQECAPTLAHIPFLSFLPRAETSTDLAAEPGVYTLCPAPVFLTTPGTAMASEPPGV